MSTNYAASASNGNGSFVALPMKIISSKDQI